MSGEPSDDEKRALIARAETVFGLVPFAELCPAVYHGRSGLLFQCELKNGHHGRHTCSDFDALTEAFHETEWGVR